MIHQRPTRQGGPARATPGQAGLGDSAQPDPAIIQRPRQHLSVDPNHAHTQ